MVAGDGPRGNAVKDAQRNKAGPATRRTRSPIWGARARGDRTAAPVPWYRELLAGAGATTAALAIAAAADSSSPAPS